MLCIHGRCVLAVRSMLWKCDCVVAKLSSRVCCFCSLRCFCSFPCDFGLRRNQCEACSVDQLVQGILDRPMPSFVQLVGCDRRTDDCKRPLRSSSFFRRFLRSFYILFTLLFSPFSQPFPLANSSRLKLEDLTEQCQTIISGSYVVIIVRVADLLRTKSENELKI